MESQSSTEATTMREEEHQSPSMAARSNTHKAQVVVIHGKGYVWDLQDVMYLWRHCRVVGSLVGSLPRHPHQTSTLGLPLSLLPEEVTLLVEEGLGETVQYKEMKEKPLQTLKDTFQECRDKCYKEQVEEAARQRRDQVKRMADKILEGKRKKFLMKQKKKQETKQRNDTIGKEFTLTREGVIQEEEGRLQSLPPHLQVVEVFTKHPLLHHLTREQYPWPYPTNRQEKVRSKVFRDLWRQNFYLTPGFKFGGDFLVYAGDPHLYHAHAIVRCVQDLQLCSGGEVDLVAATRVAASTKKTFVLATIDDTDEVLYRSYHWFEEEEEEMVEDSDIEEL